MVSDKTLFFYYELEVNYKAIWFDFLKKFLFAGPGLVFIVYPEAISRTLPLPHLWASLFFFMLFTLGLDSEFALLETFLTALYDSVPMLRKKKLAVTGITCFSCFLLGIPLCSSVSEDLLKSFFFEKTSNLSGIIEFGLLHLNVLFLLVDIKVFNN